MRTLLLVILVVTLGGCGFHLRGRAQLPPAMAVTYIAYPQAPGTQPSPLVPVLARILRANGVKIATNPKAARATLDIIGDGSRRRTLATDQSGNVRETELIYEVTYRVNLPDGSIIVPSDKIRISRNIVYPETQVLGRFEGEQMTLREMINDAAYSIVRRIQALSRHSRKPS